MAREGYLRSVLDGLEQEEEGAKPDAGSAALAVSEEYTLALERLNSESVSRQQMVERVASARRAQERLVELLLSSHKQCSDPVDWHAIRSTQPPSPPSRHTTCEQEAQLKLERYKPGLSDRLLKRSQKRQAELTAALETARLDDERAYSDALARHSEACASVDKARSLAERVLAAEPGAFLEALEETDPLEANLGRSVYFEAGPHLVAATLQLLSQDMFPSSVLIVEADGTPSFARIPAELSHLRYREHVCSCVLRVAREVLAILPPVETVLVTAEKERFNPATGNEEGQPILSIVMPRHTLEGLDFDRLTPSAAMANFPHRMAFQEGEGFRRIEPLSVTQLDTLQEVGVYEREDIPPEIRVRVLARDDYICRYCGSRSQSLHIDHVIPVVRGGGGTTLDNLVTACAQCNLRKGGRTPEEVGFVLLQPGTLLG